MWREIGKPCNGRPDAGSGPCGAGARPVLWPQEAPLNRPAEHTAADLLARCASGDRAAFRRLYDGWASRLHGVALAITRQPALAADAVQDAFVQAWQQAGRFDPARGSAEAWLVSLARYRALDIVRARGREEPGYEPPEVADEAPDALERLLGDAAGAALHRCLGQLDAERRQLVMLAFVEGLSHGDLAQRLGLALGTVKSSIRRSLIALRGCMEP